MATSTPLSTVLVLDFGAQYGQLIARRVRDLNVYSEIVPCDISADEVREKNPGAIILSGGPASVYAEDAPSVDPEIFELGIPVLGFCYGQQIMAKTLGGTVSHTEKGEYGPAPLTRIDGVDCAGCGGTSALYGETPHEQTVWMSHRDAVSEVPEGFTVTAVTDVCPVASMECPERKLYATQFHPEVRHTPYGQEMLANFLFNIAGLEPNWTMDSIIDDSVAAIREQVGSDRVILGLSGGVDSSVVAALCAKAIGKQLVCVFVNHGLLRKNEPEEVEEVFTKQFDVDFIHVHAEDRYAQLLAGVTDPEAKRRIMLGSYLLSAGVYEKYYYPAQQVRRLITQDYERAYEQCDVILAPTSPRTAFKFGEIGDPVEMHLSDIFTVSINIAGNGGMNVPCGLGKDTGLPVGVQLICPQFKDVNMFRAAAALEAAYGVAPIAPAFQAGE